MFYNFTNSLIIRCAEGSVLNVGQVKPEGKRLMTAKDWWNGLQDGGGGFVVLGLSKTKLDALLASRPWEKRPAKLATTSTTSTTRLLAKS